MLEGLESEVAICKGQKQISGLHVTYHLCLTLSYSNPNNHLQQIQCQIGDSNTRLWCIYQQFTSFRIKPINSALRPAIGGFLGIVVFCFTKCLNSSNKKIPRFVVSLASADANRFFCSDAEFQKPVADF